VTRKTAAAKRLDELRCNWLNPEEVSEAELKKHTLTNLYNARPTWLANAHGVRKIAVTMAGVKETARIRDYEVGDAPEITRLFYETVRSVNRADYSEEQVEAWAPSVPDPDEWNSRMASRQTLVAEEGSEVVGFAELEGDGHLDMLFLLEDAVGRGVGRRLYRAVEREALGSGLPRIFTEASITARPFFERQGFRVVREQTVSRRGVPMTNFAMEKPLRPSDGEEEQDSYRLSEQRPQQGL
jgi:putative acetyltransferase